jgi:LPXTG-motif cell wall-anchored protein
MRLAAVSALAGVVVLSASSAALAADAVTGTVTPGNLHTTVANPLGSAGHKTTTVSQLTLRLSNGKKGGLVYCVDFTDFLGNGTYTEGPAKGSIRKYNIISWVLANSLPVVPADDVLTAAKAQLPGETDIHKQFEDSADFLVYVGTQAAIWELSNPDSFRLGRTYSSTLDVSEKQYAVILKVHDYLVGLEDPEKLPKASLTIAPSSATGTVGTKVGPFKATSGGPDVNLTVTGGKLVDKDGKEITSVKDNGQFWVTSDTAGQAKIHGTATFEVPAGRLFFTTNSDNRPGQTVISSGTGKKKADADATATFTPQVESASPSPSPSPGLPVTGANVTGAAIGGGVLLLAGIGLVLVLRRRRVKFTA